ncbi:MAG TPA: biotin/lipoyl-containing protein, partial [Sphingomicrobium sp.]|nr:biotin/lipoyl-containing protein [Sphingomicrobium sp.]
LKFTQDDIGIDGWSVETRVYAEDPYRGFLPSTGRLVRYRPPVQTPNPRVSGNEVDFTQRRRDAEESETGSNLSASSAFSARTKSDFEQAVVRVDDGVAEGGEVSMFYDPMIAKLVTWAPTRDAAIDAQVDALDQFVIDGINDNVDFLSALMQHPRYRSGEITTGFIAEEYADGFHGAPADDQLIADLAVIAGMVSVIGEERALEISDQLGERVYMPCERIVRIDGGAEHKVRIKPYTGGTLAILDGGELIDIVGRWHPGQRLLTVLIDGRKRIVQVRRAGRDWELQTRGSTHRVQVLSPHVADLSHFMIDKPPPDLSRLLLAPMPGLLTKLDVKVGDKVEPGQPVAVMEAMKMENILRAPKAATVKATPAKPGDSLAVDQVIVEFE